MNYQKLYDNLVSFRQANPASGYTEKHHILMKSMGGSDDPTNLVVLTGREHWIAHLLLYKIHRNSQTAHACHMMAMRCEERVIPFVKNSRMYEFLRIRCAAMTSVRMKSRQAGIGNSQFGTQWICNLTLKENKKISKDDTIPNGWIPGRNKWIHKKKKNSHRKRLLKQLCITNGIDNLRLYWEDQLPIPDGWREGFTLSENHLDSVANARRIHNASLKGSNGQGGWRKRKL